MIAKNSISKRWHLDLSRLPHRQQSDLQHIQKAVPYNGENFTEQVR